VHDLGLARALHGRGLRRELKAPVGVLVAALGAHVLLDQDRPADAAAAVARIEEVPAPNDLEWRIKRLAARGKLAAREGHAEQALRQARAAVALADPTEMFLFRADAWRDLAAVAHRVGEVEEAAAARATALRLYRAKGNVAAANQLALSV
jgi:Flp pilus assembly protein TadD